MPAISERLKKLPAAKPQRTEPLWKGPEVDGITQSMLSRFLVCRERFRVAYIVGLKPNDVFTPVMEFGNMWHACEEAHAANEPWELRLQLYCSVLCRKYPLQQEQINHWYEMAKALFPVYVEHWSLHPDVIDRTPLMQEQVFNVPYKLPSGRTVRLRGKFDSVDLIGKEPTAGIYLQENKTKSSIDVSKLTRQLGFDLQTMLYLVALELVDAESDEGLVLSTTPVRGIRYNVIRRSAHKSVESMMKKVSDDFQAGRIDEWFARWKVEISANDVARFRRECLDPILEQLCTWWDWITYCQSMERDLYSPNDGAWEGMTAHHWRHPFGVYNVLDEGGSSDLDSYLETGSEVGLRRVDKLFEELN